MISVCILTVCPKTELKNIKDKEKRLNLQDDFLISLANRKLFPARSI